METDGQIIESDILLTTLSAIVTAGDIYWVYPGICEIPIGILNDPAKSAYVYTLVEVTRSVCRSLCSVTYSDYCSSFMYINANRSCILTPYTGEWVASNANSCVNTSTVLEFYRRQRHLGKHICNWYG